MSVQNNLVKVKKKVLRKTANAIEYVFQRDYSMIKCLFKVYCSTKICP